MSQISEYIRKDYPTLQQDSSLAKAIHEIKRHHRHHSIVLDSEGRLSGIISTADLYKRVLDLSNQTSGKEFTKKSLESIPVSECMTRAVVTVSIVDTVSDCKTLMKSSGHTVLPIIDGDRYVGVVHALDLL